MLVKVKENLVGKVFGKLTVLEQTEDFICSNGKHMAKWLCKCECGSKPVAVVGRYLIRGHTQSCGCMVNVFHKVNNYDLTGEYGIGWTFNTNREFYFDLEDYDKIKEYCWYKDFSNGYMKTKTVDNKWIYMHRFVTNNQYKIVDHINRNKLDNRKENLRNATKRQNILNRDGVISTNTSGITGVYFDNKRNKWRVQICVDDKIKYLGIFINKEDAIKTRLQAEDKYFGKSAPQRHLFEQYGITTQNDYMEV